MRHVRGRWRMSVRRDDPARSRLRHRGAIAMDRAISAECVDPELPGLYGRDLDREKRKTGAGKKGREESGEHLSEIRNERTRRWTRRTERHRQTKGRRREPLTLNSVWIRPRALFAANFSARCRFVQRFYRRIEKIRMLSIFPFPSVSSPRAPFCFHRGAARKKVSQRDRKDLAAQAESFEKDTVS